MARPKLLLDENIGLGVALRLREDGHNVASIAEEAPGSADVDVLRRAKSEKRIVVTLDKDFGALIFRDSKGHIGVLFLRLNKESPEQIYTVVSSVLRDYGNELDRRFTVASEWYVRMKE